MANYLKLKLILLAELAIGDCIFPILRLTQHSPVSAKDVGMAIQYMVPLPISYIYTGSDTTPSLVLTSLSPPLEGFSCICQRYGRYLERHRSATTSGMLCIRSLGCVRYMSIGPGIRDSSMLSTVQAICVLYAILQLGS